MIGDQMGGQPTSKPLIDIKPRFCDMAPLVTTPFNAIHIHEIEFAAEARYQTECRRVIAERQQQSRPGRSMQGRLQIKDDGCQSAVALHGHMPTRHPSPDVRPYGAFTFNLAIDRYTPIAIFQVNRQLFRECFKPAMKRGYSTSPQY